MAIEGITDDEIRDLARRLAALSRELSPRQRAFLDEILGGGEVRGYRSAPDTSSTPDYYRALNRYSVLGGAPDVLYASTLQNL